MTKIETKEMAPEEPFERFLHAHGANRSSATPTHAISMAASWSSRCDTCDCESNATATASANDRHETVWNPSKARDSQPNDRDYSALLAKMIDKEEPCSLHGEACNCESNPPATVSVNDRQVTVWEPSTTSFPRDYSALLAQLIEEEQALDGGVFNTTSHASLPSNGALLTPVSSVLFSPVGPDQRPSTPFGQLPGPTQRPRIRYAKRVRPGVRVASARSPRLHPAASSSGFLFGLGPQNLASSSIQPLSASSSRSERPTHLRNPGYEFGTGLLTSGVLPGASVVLPPSKPSISRPQFPFKSYEDGFSVGSAGRTPATSQSKPKSPGETPGSSAWDWNKSSVGESGIIRSGAKQTPSPIALTVDTTPAEGAVDERDSKVDDGEDVPGLSPEDSSTSGRTGTTAVKERQKKREIPMPVTSLILVISHESRIAVGLTGATYKATMDGTTPVAVKIVKNVQSKGAVTRFYDEIKRLQSLPSHSHVVKCYGYVPIHNGKQVGIVTALVAGHGTTSLANRLYRSPASSAAMAEKTKYRVILQLLDALVHLHYNDVTHRDLSPKHVLLTSKNGVVSSTLVDFGLPTLKNGAVSALAATGALGFDPAYASPELLSGELAVDDVEAWKKSDVYSFAVLLMEILLEEHSWEGELPVFFTKAVRKRGQRPFDVEDIRVYGRRSSELETAISQAWRQKPGERPTAAALRGELEKLLI